MSAHSPLSTGDPGRAPVDQRTVRRVNLGRVLGHVADRGAVSRATIAAGTGLNKTTVSSLVTELIDMRVLVDTGNDERPGNVGRPAQTVRLSSTGVVSLGLEVNIDYLATCATDLTGQVLHARTVAVDNRARAPGLVVGRLASMARDALDEVRGRSLSPVGVTIAAPGLVDVASGTVVVAPDLGWQETPLVELIGDRLGLSGVPIRVDNEANLGALAELWEGAGRRLANFVYVSAEVGVGAGVVMDGRLYRGASGFAGELGHLTVDPDGPRCTCGNRGCLSMLVGEDVLLQIAGVEAPPDASERLAATELAARVRAGDRRMRDALGQVGEWLGIGLAGVVNLLNPEAVILGGYLGALLEWLEPPLRTALSEHVLAGDWSPCEILASSLGEHAAVRGAAALALREVIADPASIRAQV
jgi:predicted NBD/HSP70 family sugar kinase